MADINQVITLGIGTPGDIEHFILVGLNAGDAAPAADVTTILRVARGLAADSFQPTLNAVLVGGRRRIG